MARDRQRAKQRRAKRQHDQNPPARPAAGSASTRARDMGLDQAEADDAGLGATTPPEPTKHAFPDVEQASLAEAGPVGYGDQGVDSAPDEVEGDLIPGGVIDPAAAEERAAASGRAGRRKRGKVITFLGHSIDELKRVQWPDRRHTAQGTAVTLGFVVLAGGFLGLMDAIWRPLIEALI